MINLSEKASEIAARFFGHPSLALTIIAVTGTNGKTSVASILYSIFFSAGINSAQIGTLGFLNNTNDQKSSYTTPEAIELNDYFLKLKKAKSTHVVMEVSSHALDQYRVEKIDFNMAVFTNLTPEHLDYHKTLESYYKTKLKLFKSMSSDSIAVINKSDFHGEKIIKTIKTPTKSY
jgi:UDP-N-acetylmuramoyl-L-alanyl-D-glutamate--2,6-diaminopimelate ligase